MAKMTAQFPTDGCEAPFLDWRLNYGNPDTVGNPPLKVEYPHYSENLWQYSFLTRIYNLIQYRNWLINWITWIPPLTLSFVPRVGQINFLKAVMRIVVLEEIEIGKREVLIKVPHLYPQIWLTPHLASNFLRSWRKASTLTVLKRVIIPSSDQKRLIGTIKAK